MGNWELPKVYRRNGGMNPLLAYLSGIKEMRRWAAHRKKVQKRTGDVLRDREMKYWCAMKKREEYLAEDLCQFLGLTGTGIAIGNPANPVNATWCSSNTPG